MKLFNSALFLVLGVVVKTAVIGETDSVRTTDDEHISPVNGKNIETYFNSVASYCPAKKLCENVSTEIGRWECLGESLFFATAADNDFDASPRFERLVVSDCSGVGFGNAIRGYYSAVGIAAALGRRMVVEYGPMQRMFLPPYGDSWDYGLEARVIKQHHQEAIHMERFHFKFMNTEHFDFEAHGRSPGRFLAWSNSLKSSSAEISAYAPEPDIIAQLPEPWKQYSNKPLLNAGICGGEREMLTTGSCLPEILRKFVNCVRGVSQHTDQHQYQYQYLQEFELSIPFYFSLFRRPGPKMLKALRTIRKRIGLPQLQPGVERGPGQWALRTPGYYIFALHFRNIPLGFEPLSADLNELTVRKRREELQNAFWLTAESNAARAKEIADCRGEKLLIYFASDDVRLRKVARRRLSRWGKVVWGLRESDVGHASPQWRPVDEETIGKAAQRFLDEPSPSPSPGALLAEVEVSISGTPATAEVQKSEDLIVQVKKDEDAVALHGEMAIVEWWILANAQWLQSHSGTSFSDSASGWGLGPLGGMERIDIVHGPGHVSVTHRRNWTEGIDQDNSFCREVGAADPDQARQCPNT